MAKKKKPKQCEAICKEHGTQCARNAVPPSGIGNFCWQHERCYLFSTRLPLLHVKRDQLYGYGPQFDLDLACGRATSIPQLVTAPKFPLMGFVKPAPTAADAVRISRNALRR